ncbi:MAG: SCO family protein [Betaproteobacteria bacterium]|jgi:protein SCO1/2|nr:SCO family protein [Betaproteobacteria bacterium]
MVVAIVACAGFVTLGIAAYLLFDGRTPAPQSRYRGIDVLGQMQASFRLVDTTGRIRTPADFRGKPLVVYFGFLNCPDVCPTFLNKMKAVKAALASDGDVFQVALVTLDPRRDTPEAMRDYLAVFDPAYVGLIPHPGELDALLVRFKAFAQTGAPDATGNYTVDHTTFGYVFDKEARLRLLMPHELTVDDWVRDLRQLL